MLAQNLSKPRTKPKISGSISHLWKWKRARYFLLTICPRRNGKIWPIGRSICKRNANASRRKPRTFPGLSYPPFGKFPVQTHSTFRNSVEAVVKKIYGEQNLEKRTNDFIDGLEIEYRLVEHDKLDSEETKEIGGTYLRIFNQQHNGGNDLRKKYGITQKMTDLRGEI